VFESYCKEKLGPLVLRVALGLACVYHGFLKIMAAGGTTWAPGVHVAWQVVLAWGEFAAGLAILLGFRCRLAALVVLVVTPLPWLWWQGWNVLQLPLRTLEPLLLIVLMGLALLFLGAGELSVDGRGGGTKAAPAKPAKKK
jgi:uncharacterized membrane protein YphA (DoxX/SURF4 family)